MLEKWYGNDSFLKIAFRFFLSILTVSMVFFLCNGEIKLKSLVVILGVPLLLLPMSIYDYMKKRSFS